MKQVISDRETIASLFAKASQKRLRMSVDGDLVVRASGVWDSRVPLWLFREEHSRFNRLCFAQSLALDQMIGNAEECHSRGESTLAGFLGKKRLKQVPGRAFRSYRKAFGVTKPSVGDFAHDLKDGVQFVREATVILYVGMFETFVACWALNMLLAKLEHNSWEEGERIVAEEMSPIHHSKRFKQGHLLPSLSFLIRSFPDVIRDLEQAVPAGMSESYGSLSSKTVNVYRAMLFWKDYRNLCVHRSRVLSKGFCGRWSEIWNALRNRNRKIPKLEAGQQLCLYDDVVRSLFSDLQMAAELMNKRLVGLSTNDRGTVPPVPEKGQLTPFPLLQEGDHSLSHQWVLVSKQGESAQELEEERSSV